MKLLLLVSGGLGLHCLQQLLQSNHAITGVLTDRRSTAIIDCCAQNAIPYFIGNPREGRAKAFLADKHADVLLSINYLFIIESDLIRFPQRYAINFHGSLLPKYRGRTPHVWAIINGEEKTGITAHLIDEALDNGSIIRQVTLPITEQMTGGEVLERFRTLYPILVMDVLSDIAQDRLSITPQNAALATYFEKRTPADGRINWNWQRERIRNWIRAQAAPYPGAFFYLANKQVVVHLAAYSDLGFRQIQPNGTLLETGSDYVIVKTPNGALRLSELENYDSALAASEKQLT